MRSADSKTSSSRMVSVHLARCLKQRLQASDLLLQFECVATGDEAVRPLP